MPHKPNPTRNLQQQLRKHIMLNSFFDRQNGDTVNVLTPESIQEYACTLVDLDGSTAPPSIDCEQGEVLIEPRGQGSLQK